MHVVVTKMEFRLKGEGLFVIWCCVGFLSVLHPDAI